jgi:Concanavalin A-like lectin/glucanases superfamily
MGNELIGRWTFDEGAGNHAADSSGNHNHGTIRPADAPDPKWGSGQFAGSILCSGRDGFHVSIPASESINNIRKQLTVTAYVYARTLWPDSPSGTPYISVVQRQWRKELHPDLFYLGYGPLNHATTHDGPLQYKWHVGLVDDGEPDGGEVDLYRRIHEDEAPKVDEWVHMAGTYDADTGVMRLYVNGQMIGELTRPGELRLDQQTEERPIVIGCEINFEEVAGAFDGYVDEVQVYSRALSPDEISSLAAEARAGRSR